MEGQKGGHGNGGVLGRGHFLRIIHPRYGQWKVLQKKLKTKFSKKGGHFFSFRFFSLVCVRIMKFDSDMAAKLLLFFYVKTKKKFEGGIWGTFFWRRDHGFFICSILHTTFIHVYLNKLSHTLLLNGRDKNNEKK